MFAWLSFARFGKRSTRKLVAAFLARVLLLSLGATVPACLSEGHFGKFDQAQVLSFAIVGELTPAVIDQGAQTITVQLGSDAALSQAELEALTLSSLATASAQVGDVLDLSQDYELKVRAENGDTSVYQVVADVGGGGSGGSGLGGAGGALNCDSYLVDYQITGTFSITNTPGGLGDDQDVVGPGELQLRYTPTGLGEGDVAITYYRMPQNFLTEAPGATTTTDTLAEAGPDECGLNQGRLEGKVLSWAACDYGPQPPLGTTSWGTSDIVGGPGCLANYSVTGSITCQGTFCAASGVNFPIILDDLYPQPLNSFELSDDFTRFSMHSMGAPAINQSAPGVELPNQEPSRSFISLEGTQTGLRCASACSP